ncbi:MAG: EI24 domain-containing protein, partial [Advenella sp.]
AYAFTHMLRFDALVEHATRQERAQIIARRRGGGWLIGTICATINLIPLTWIVLPVFTSLVYAHHGLAALAEQRRNSPPLLSAQSDL